MKLTLLTEDKKDKNFFDYSKVEIELVWGDKIKEAQDRFKTDFSTENDYIISQRTITIDQNQWDFSKCKFKCEMREAGGDWETPLRYFRCQLIDGYAEGVSQYSDPFFCVIPDKEGGNLHLIQSTNDSGEKGYVLPASDDYDKVPEPNDRKCWQYLKDYLTLMVNNEIKNVKSGR